MYYVLIMFTVFALIEDRSYIFFIDLKWGSYIRGGLVIDSASIRRISGISL